MNASYYEHSDKPFTDEIAAELIFKRYRGKSEVTESCLSKELFDYHKKGGGLPPLRSERKRCMELGDLISSKIESGLRILGRNGCAHRSGHRVWHIHDRKDNHQYPITIGEGTDCVYLYYCPADKALKEESIPVWKKNRSVYYPCNIGRTARCPRERVEEKSRDFPEPPVLALIMHTDKSEELEAIIHRILTYKDRLCKEAQRTDWFYTNPEEVEHIFEAIEIV